MERLSISTLLTVSVCSIQFWVELSRSVSGLLMKYWCWLSQSMWMPNMSSMAIFNLWKVVRESGFPSLRSSSIHSFWMRLRLIILEIRMVSTSQVYCLKVSVFLIFLFFCKDKNNAVSCCETVEGIFLRVERGESVIM